MVSLGYGVGWATTHLAFVREPKLRLSLGWVICPLDSIRSSGPPDTFQGPDRGLVDSPTPLGSYVDLERGLQAASRPPRQGVTPPALFGKR